MSHEKAPMAALGVLVGQRTEKTSGRKNQEWPYLGLEHLDSGSPFLNGKAQSSASTSTNNIFYKGDVLFGKLRPYLKKSVGAPFSGYCSTDILVLRPAENIDAGYVAKLFQSEAVFAEANATAIGTKMPRTSWGSLRSFEVFCPHLPEQRRIAEILDTLDEAIRKTEQVIAKLQQMKQGLLQDLLTRGIDDNGEVRDQERHPEQFKDTQLGWIPKGWDAVPASTLLLGVEQGWSPDCEAEPAEKGSWGVLKTTAVTWSRYDDSANKALPGHLRPRPEYEVKANDVLMTRAGPNSRVGVVALVTETQGRLMLSDKMYRLLPNTEKVSPEYLALALSGEKTQRHLATLKTGLAESQTNISQSIVLSLWIPLPGLAEQDRICDRHASLSRQAQLEALVLAKLLVLKKGLMNDLLTGRVRATINEEVGAA